MGCDTPLKASKSRVAISYRRNSDTRVPIWHLERNIISDVSLSVFPWKNLIPPTILVFEKNRAISVQTDTVKEALSAVENVVFRGMAVML